MENTTSEAFSLTPADILATCQQTRFDIKDKKLSDITIEQLTISIRPTASASKPASNARKAKGAAAAGATRDILVDARLRLKPGVHYGLLGRNGSGKSTLLRAIATKVIPSLPPATKISLLQQTSPEGGSGRQEAAAAVAASDGVSESMSAQNSTSSKSALQYVVESDDARNQIQDELKILTHIEPNVDEEHEDLARLRAYRRLQFSRAQQKLVQMQKDAALRSGTRGYQSRKELVAFEEEVLHVQKRINERPLTSDALHDELAKASQLAAELQAELDEQRPLSDVLPQAVKTLSDLGFSDAMMKTPFGALSGGWQMRCMLASVLVQECDVMILDEPTNFLDLFGIVWLQERLVRLRSEWPDRTVIVVSHDRDFVDHVCQEILLIEKQRLVAFCGNLSEFEADVRGRRRNLTRMKENQDKQIAHMERTIASNIKAGRKQGDDNKLRQAVSRQKRLDDRMGMQSNAKGAKFKLSRDMPGYHLSRRAAIEIPPKERTTAMVLPPASELRFPGALVALDGVSFAYGRSTDSPVIDRVSLSIHMGSRVGIVGLNGSGKSTLVGLATETLTPTAGTVSRHPRLKMGYYSQLAVDELRSAAVADPAVTALGRLASASAGQLDEASLRGLLASFHLAGHVASHVPVAQLSGGQLVRLALACIVWDHPHVLVLDEVTTHLDFYTVQALSRALRQFDGALLIVSHDRFFVKCVIEGNAELLAGEDGSDEGEDIENEPDDGDGTSSIARQGRLYLMKKGRLTLLERGVAEFEDTLQRRVEKMAA